MKFNNQKGEMEHKTIKDKEGNVIEEHKKETTTDKGIEITAKDITAITGLITVIGTIITYFVS